MLHIVGTGHHYQLGVGVRFGRDYCSQEDESAFAKTLRDLATSCAAVVLAEELNQQALTEKGKSTSVLHTVATELQLQHLFCEPDRVERVALGIQDENEIRLSAFPRTLDEQVVRDLVAESWSRREQEWIRRLTPEKSKSILFVCGANHIPTFVPTAQEHGFLCSVVHANWEA